MSENFAEDVSKLFAFDLVTLIIGRRIVGESVTILSDVISGVLPLWHAWQAS